MNIVHKVGNTTKKRRHNMSLTLGIQNGNFIISADAWILVIPELEFVSTEDVNFEFDFKFRNYTRRNKIDILNTKCT
jgi:hypothetical protein